jgi:hypothetical protein
MATRIAGGQREYVSGAGFRQRISRCAREHRTNTRGTRRFSTACGVHSDLDFGFRAGMLSRRCNAPLGAYQGSCAPKQPTVVAYRPGSSRDDRPFVCAGNSQPGQPCAAVSSRLRRIPCDTASVIERSGIKTRARCEQQRTACPLWSMPKIRQVSYQDTLSA